MGVKVNEDCTFCSRTVSYLTREGILMLVLSRQVDEKIIIGDSIVITVVEIRRGLVRLGIDAPRNVPVHREEVYNAIKAAEHIQPAPPPQPQENHNDTDAH
jgi:carbon storage regulator